MSKRMAGCVAAAEQTASSRFWTDGSMPDREIQITVRLQVPEEDGADVGIRPRFEPPLPPPWADALHQRLYAGVHGGPARVEAPLPTGGIGVLVTHLVIVPSLQRGGDDHELQRLGDTLEALMAGTVASLWTGLNRLLGPFAPIAGGAV